MTTQSPFSNQSPPSPSTNQFGNTVAPGSGTEGLSVGLHDALYNYVQGSEFNGVMTSQWGLYTPMYFGVGQKLPAQASTGQIAYCLVDPVESIVWQFVYFGAVQQGQSQGQGFTGFPWLFVGGPPVYSYISTNENCSSAALVNLATVGPQIAVPFAGDYDYEMGCYVNVTSAGGATATMQLLSGATTYTPQCEASGASFETRTVAGRISGLTAGAGVLAVYSISSGNVNFANRFLKIWPRRVAGV